MLDDARALAWARWYADFPSPFLPALVIVMSVFAAAVYGWLNEPIVVWLTLVLYGPGMGYHYGVARRRLVSAAPEELAARAGQEE